MFVGDMLKVESESIIRKLRPALQMRLRFITHLNVDEIASENNASSDQTSTANVPSVPAVQQSTQAPTSLQQQPPPHQQPTDRSLPVPNQPIQSTPPLQQHVQPTSSVQSTPAVQQSLQASNPLMHQGQGPMQQQQMQQMMQQQYQSQQMQHQMQSMNQNQNRMN